MKASDAGGDLMRVQTEKIQRIAAANTISYPTTML